LIDFSINDATFEIESVCTIFALQLVPALSVYLMQKKIAKDDLKEFNISRGY
jgi:hypothetical protein